MTRSLSSVLQGASFQAFKKGLALDKTVRNALKISLGKYATDFSFESLFVIWVTFEKVEYESNLTLKINLESF